MRFPCPFARLVRDIPGTIGERKSSLREACQFVILRITGSIRHYPSSNRMISLRLMLSIGKSGHVHRSVFNHLLGAYKVPRGLQLAGQPLVGIFFNTRGADR
jgi:hypothetical protein